MEITDRALSCRRAGRKRLIVSLSAAMCLWAGAWSFEAKADSPAAGGTVQSGTGSSEKDGWSAVERVSQVLSIAAIPLVIAIVGWFIQRQLQDQSLKRDYVQLAVSILREPNKSEITPELRAWAAELLNQNSPTKLGAGAIQELKSGRTILPQLEKLTPVASSAVTPALEEKYAAAFKSFQDYLLKTGFKIEDGEVRYEVVPGDVIKQDGQAYMALYDPNKKLLRIAGKHADDEDLLLHEYMRHILLKEDKPWYEPGMDVEWLPFFSISDGLSFYFPCSFQNRSRFGKGTGYVDDLDNKATFRKKAVDQPSAYELGLRSWGGAFYELRTKIGAEAVDKFLARAWMDWNPTEPPRDLAKEFVHLLIATDKNNGGDNEEEIRGVFERRKLKV